MASPLLGIIADDWTGAAECAALCATAGLSCRLVRQAEAVRAETEALVVDADHRHLDDAAAVAVVFRTWLALRRRGCQHILLKADSTLRGPLIGMAEAALTASNRRRLLFAPAHPRAGRTVVGGHLVVDGLPLHLGPAGMDPLLPIGSSRIADCFRRGMARTYAALPAELDALSPAGIHILDATTVRDLHEACTRTWDGTWVHLGSAALVEAALHQLGHQQRAVGAIESPHPWIVLRGSLHRATLAQTAHPCARTIAIDDLPATESAALVRETWAQGLLPVLALVRLRPGAERACAQRLAEVGCALKASLGCNLLVCGGMTARALVDRLQADLHPLGMPVPGLCYHRLDDGHLLLTKSGGFGGHDLLEGIRTCVWA